LKGKDIKVFWEFGDLFWSYGVYWLIPKLIFTAFDIELTKDIIKIYDPTKSPAVLLASYSGSTAPKPIVSTSGEMMVIFQTGPINTKSGWDAYYISGDFSLFHRRTVD
jgi:hypothetical protein